MGKLLFWGEEERELEGARYEISVGAVCGAWQEVVVREAVLLDK